MTQRIYIIGVKNDSLSKAGAMQHVADVFGISPRTVSNYLMGVTDGNKRRAAVLAYVKENYDCDIVTVDDDGKKSVC